jgi:hypothetical protein
MMHFLSRTDVPKERDAGVSSTQFVNDVYPKSFELQEGGKGVNLPELTQVSDWGERVKPTHMQLEV